MTEPEPHSDRELLVVQHAPHTGPSALVETLDARATGLPWRLVDVAAGAAFPDLNRVAGILVLGGPMGVGDRAEHPWMEGELEAIRAATQQGIPVFGICLGVQMLAAALEGRVDKRPAPEIGFVPLTRTEAAEDDPVFAGWPDGSAVLFIHDDEVVEVPEGAETMLEGSEGVAAWRAPDGQSYGVQFHPEITAAQLAGWAGEEINRQRCAAAGVDLDELLAEAERRDAFHRAVGVSMVGRWLDRVVGAADPAAAPGRRGRS
jgi:GMP synthase (glutamine-hydrolysing)